jgi:hypothetical protein
MKVNVEILKHIFWNFWAVFAHFALKKCVPKVKRKSEARVKNLWWGCWREEPMMMFDL